MWPIGELQLAIVAAANQLHDKAAELGFLCGLQVYWVKGHSGEVLYHTVADEVANEARRGSVAMMARIEGITGTSTVATPCVAPAYGALLDKFAHVASTTLTKRQRKRQRRSQYQLLELRPARVRPADTQAHRPAINREPSPSPPPPAQTPTDRPEAPSPEPEWDYDLPFSKLR